MDSIKITEPRRVGLFEIVKPVTGFPQFVTGRVYPGEVYMLFGHAVVHSGEGHFAALCVNPVHSDDNKEVKLVGYATLKPSRNEVS